MKKIHEKLQSVFQGRDFHERLVLMILALAFGTSVISTGQTLLGAKITVLITLALMCIVSGISLWIVYKKHKTRLASWLFILIFNVVLFPLFFIMSSGIDSGTPIWLVLELTYIFLLFRGKECVAALVISILSFFATYWAAYCYPDLVPVVTNRYYRYIDSSVTLVVVSCCIGVLLKIQSISYENEKRNAQQQKEEMEQIARSKDVFFANMSHEIRTPINTIIGLNEMTLRENISDEIAENAINIQNASKMLLTTINDILDLSKLESGKMDIVPVQYEVSAMFSDLVNLIWLRANQKDLEFRVDIAQDIPSMLYGDEVRIKQVITNLLTNAVKYTRAGSVTLTAKGERLSADSFRLRISVADTGTGIRKESLDDLFNSFKRVDEELNRNIEGTGLGLNISKQLMDMMGGKISVDSVYHKGSVFTIELEQGIVNVNPIGVIDFAAQKKLSNRQAYEESFVAPDARVLVVDDNDMNRMVVKKLLRGTEVQVDTVSGGRECLKKTAEGFYHVILMDHMMPEMDGVETTRVIRRMLGENGQVPIIALTANAVDGTRELFINEGMDDFVAKPIELRIITSKLKKWLPKEKIIKNKKKEDSGKEHMAGMSAGELSITGLDVGHALKLLGSEKLFWSVLKEYYRVIDKKYALIKEYEQSGQWKEYTIEVHALKSSSRQIGANVLANMAEHMEAAGNAEDAELIHKTTPAMLSEYIKYKDILKPYFIEKNTEQGGRQADIKKLGEFFARMEDALENLDTDDMEEVICDMEKYSYSKEHEEYFERLKNAVEDIDTEQCEEILTLWKECIQDN